MKKSSILVIVIPLLIVAVTLTAVFAWRALSSKSNEVTPTTTVREVPPLVGEGSKPTTGFSALEGTSANNAAVSDLSQELAGAVDDGGQADFDALKKEAAGL